MSWQLLIPDLPYWHQITVTQVKDGFWENLLPYAPLLTAFLTAGVAIANIMSTRFLANKARQITEQQRTIAQEKLDADLFEKRCGFFLKYAKMYNILISKDFASKKELDDFLHDITIQSIPPQFIFSNSDSDLIKKLLVEIRKLRRLRYTHLQVTPDWKEEREKFRKIIQEKLLPDLKKMLEKYVPPSMTMLPKSSNSTSNPASDPEPPPTGLRAIRMRLKRAVCGWSQPLQ
ncbi:hypothetical protein [Acetobacter orientalis]|uniref:hypothetical protein n=1 Tax=Acetobacter orientalis TaxID=146474 RepID=UPI0039EAF0E2